MIFQKQESQYEEELNQEYDENVEESNDTVETVVGPSVNVEGDFVSEGNIIVKGTVSGSVRTSRHLLVDPGAKIMANVKAGSAQISGEVSGNLKVQESLELTSTAKIVGDINVKTLSVEAGALVYGKISMPGVEPAAIKKRTVRSRITKKTEVEGAE